MHPHMQNTEETIAKYAVDANLFRLGSTNPKKNIQPLDVFWWGLCTPPKKNFFKNKKDIQKLSLFNPK